MSAVWERTTEFLSDHFGGVAGIAALSLFMPAAIGDILTPVRAGAGPGLALGLSALALAIGIVSLWGQLAITALAIDPPAGTADARSRATRRLGPMILVWVALVAIGVVLTLPVLAILFANGVDPMKLNQAAAVQAVPLNVAGMIGLYALVLIPAALWLAARIVILSTAVVVAERLLLGALGRSFRLTRGLALRIIGVLLLYGVMMWVTTLAVTTVVGSVLRLLLDGEGAITVASALTTVATALAATIFSVIGTAFAAKLYVAARDREAPAPAAAAPAAVVQA